jgi:crotonobetainyl-CoA:carnitine CoA-transferase CaiB-like acyl-CoA transferase
MTDTRRKTTPTDDAAAGRRASDPTEDYMEILDRLDELGKKLAERLGIPVAAVNGTLTREERLAQDQEELDREIAEEYGTLMRKKPRARPAKPEVPAKPVPTSEQRAREAALITFKYQPRKSTTLH